MKQKNSGVLLKIAIKLVKQLLRLLHIGAEGEVVADNTYRCWTYSKVEEVAAVAEPVVAAWRATPKARKVARRGLTRSSSGTKAKVVLLMTEL